MTSHAQIRNRPVYTHTRPHTGLCIRKTTVPGPGYQEPHCLVSLGQACLGLRSSSSPARSATPCARVHSPSSVPQPRWASALGPPFTSTLNAHCLLTVLRVASSVSYFWSSLSLLYLPPCPSSSLRDSRAGHTSSSRQSPSSQSGTCSPRPGCPP